MKTDSTNLLNVIKKKIGKLFKINQRNNYVHVIVIVIVIVFESWVRYEYLLFSQN